MVLLTRSRKGLYLASSMQLSVSGRTNRVHYAETIKYLLSFNGCLGFMKAPEFSLIIFLFLAIRCTFAERGHQFFMLFERELINA